MLGSCGWLSDRDTCALRSNLVSENTMKVIHRDQEHLVSFSLDEVASLLDPCSEGCFLLHGIDLLGQDLR